MPSTAVPGRTYTWLWLLMLLLASATALLAWVVLSLKTGTQLGWMAVAVALELVFMLRLGTLRGGLLRMSLVVGGTLLITALSWWIVASAWMGGSMGLLPWESALRMGPRLAWTLIDLATTLRDWLWVGAAVLLGAWLGGQKAR